MSGPSVVAPRAGEVIGDAPDRRVEILGEHEALHATWSRFGPGREPVAVPAGTLVRVPPLVVHGFRNASRAEVRYLNLHAPGLGFADYLRAMRDGRQTAYDQHPPPSDGGRPPEEAAIGGGERVAGGVTRLADVEEIAVYEVEGAQPPPADPGRLRSLYVLEGELTLGDLRACAGSWVTLPPGISHGEPAGAARFLDIRTPG